MPGRICGVDLLLVHPEIPHNTGCAARLAAATGQRLHLVEPLGFSLDDRHLKRAGLDYWPMVDLVIHRDWESALRALAAGDPRSLARRLRLFTARGGNSLFDVRFEADDVLCFGAESTGRVATRVPRRNEFAPEQAERPAREPLRLDIELDIERGQLGHDHGMVELGKKAFIDR